MRCEVLVVVMLVGCKTDVPQPVNSAALVKQDVRALADEFAAVNRLKITSIERLTVGEFALHVVHLEQGPVPADEVSRFSDAQYVVVDRGGALAELGVLSLVDESVTHFKRGASFSMIGEHRSPLGTLLQIRLDTWYRADAVKTTAGLGTATHASSSLLVCRWDGGLVCARVPLGGDEIAEQAQEQPGGAWGAAVEYSQEAGSFAFTLKTGDAATADALGLPRGRVGVAELFARYPAGDVGQSL